MLESMNHIYEVKRKSPNAVTEIRNSKLFSQRATNSFQGGAEHEMRKTIAAFLGMKIHVSSEKFHCFLTSDVVCFINKLIK